MTYTSLKRTQQQTDLLAADHLAECPDCHEYAHATATCCDGCGTHLYPGKKSTAGPRAHLGDGSEAQQKEHIMTTPTGCTCGSRGICTVCVLADIGGDPFVASLDHGLELVHDALDRPNVVALHEHSKKVPS